ncbi:Hypothetical protein PFCIRM119_01835 [Propionibacterium freudenreichii]|uniref:Uncharacterized protein n=1 Tax=Propionibacterium freudenreichii subsp. shermanii (strain ATCC 9614 / DSM 4902 / CIP 103027 / NCIMB 8099 / CIRM-BIA1) TaxID=754252 RepID=D7GEE7_PROFC|nr:Hypothetical protein PFREUD_14080 [Propionibacterium freudenreichii subsp. shermanii CIRM-BIA1]CDP47570.1 Hypothetical protein PFCIRM129_00085 [Propionibacterium freudenreichii subsp. freudenreichii]CEG85861.1 Hypothetical protein PFCIRM118_03440 [Propionibacterium freudenreichii]CEG90565.1 Hypothetical protein PFCIRM119_01835 [Propionibacterium freudenreichii]CEG95318.1 Hypothetical protein PFCIRM123_07565 [Propionibacterium freudenreichii]
MIDVARRTIPQVEAWTPTLFGSVDAPMERHVSSRPGQYDGADDRPARFSVMRF